MNSPDLRPADDDAAIEAVLAALQRGECIGLPTETVYGLAADALNPAAVRRIFALKGRPADHPVIVHLPSAQHLDDYAIEVPDYARALAAAFWPGPLTLILRRAPGVPREVSGGQDTVGLRVPAHPLAQRVLQRFGRGLAAPSANRFGRISPTTAEHVRSEFGDAVPVLDGGPCRVGIESTIVDCSTERPRILRPGMLLPAQIEAVCGPLLAATGPAPRVSGDLEKHYAPRAPLRLAARAELTGVEPTARLLTLGPLPAGRRGRSLGEDPTGYASALYAALRELDQPDGAAIVVEQPPDSAAWAAIRDRLRRAAAGSGEPPSSPLDAAVQAPTASSRIPAGGN